ncbi:phosphopantetheine-binding protein [Novipirellula sp. SH528]|uniref:phosphopantetheine-binding protein n=1 Tax=Novipirellula sp. SH528 TaxID=3454466 RepID=UPI003FA0EA15
MITDSQLALAITEWLSINSLEPAIHMQIFANTNLFEAGAIDSLGLVQLIDHVNDVSGYELDLLEVDPDDLTTIAGICRCVNRQNPKQG